MIGTIDGLSSKKKNEKNVHHPGRTHVSSGNHREEMKYELKSNYFVGSEEGEATKKKLIIRRENDRLFLVIDTLKWIECHRAKGFSYIEGEQKHISIPINFNGPLNSIRIFFRMSETTPRLSLISKIEISMILFSFKIQKRALVFISTGSFLSLGYHRLVNGKKYDYTTQRVAAMVCLFYLSSSSFRFFSSS